MRTNATVEEGLRSCCLLLLRPRANISHYGWSQLGSIKVKVKLRSAPIKIGRARRPTRPALISAGFCSMKRLRVFLLPMAGIPVHHRLPPGRLFPRNFLVLIYTSGWREARQAWFVSCLLYGAGLDANFEFAGFAPKQRYTGWTVSMETVRTAKS